MKRRPFVLLTLCFAAGIGCGEYIEVPLRVLAAGIAGGILLVLASWKRPAVSAFFLLAVFVLSGMFYVKTFIRLSGDDISRVAKYYRGRSVKVEGIVISDVEHRAFRNGQKTMLILKVLGFESRWGWKKKAGRLQVNIYGKRELAYGDRLIIEGKIHRPFEFKQGEAFSYRDYLRRKKIYHILSVKKTGPVKRLETGRGNPVMSRCLAVKHRLQAVLYRELSRGEAGIMDAVLLGDRYNVPAHIKDLFVFSGVAHVLAISGLHIGIVAFLIFFLLKMVPLPRKYNAREKLDHFLGQNKMEYAI